MMRISNNRYIKILACVIAAIVFNIAAITLLDFDINGKLTLSYSVQGQSADTFQTFYKLSEEEWSEQSSIKQEYTSIGETQEFIYELPKSIDEMRVDLGQQSENIILSHISLQYLWKEADLGNILVDSGIPNKDIKGLQKEANKILVDKSGTDAYIVLDLEELHLSDWFKIDAYINVGIKILVCLAINSVFLLLILKRRAIKVLISDLYNNRQLIWNLSKNDFKTRYAGSYLGITWAFIQPVVTILVYWFVFEFGLKAGAPMPNVPFIVWFATGLIPWFFFQDALLNATNCMMEYSYLVKKIVFKVSILPVVKIVSAVLVHFVFIGILFCITGFYGFGLSKYSLQLIYYSICTFCISLALSYITSAIVIFFKDLGQLISIFLQIGMWMTPIMWSYTIVPENLRWIIKLNPMDYIVEGYRDTFINHVWFYDKGLQTIYFWGVTIAIFAVGAIIFKRLKPHFADVL